jgi:hypothetical protein
MNHDEPPTPSVAVDFVRKNLLTLFPRLIHRHFCLKQMPHNNQLASSTRPLKRSLCGSSSKYPINSRSLSNGDECRKFRAAERHLGHCPSGAEVKNHFSMQVLWKSEWPHESYCCSPGTIASRQIAQVSSSGEDASDGGALDNLRVVCGLGVGAKNYGVLRWSNMVNTNRTAGAKTARAGLDTDTDTLWAWLVKSKWRNWKALAPSMFLRTI